MINIVVLQIMTPSCCLYGEEIYSCTCCTLISKFIVLMHLCCRCFIVEFFLEASLYWILFGYMSFYYGWVYRSYWYYVVLQSLILLSGFWMILWLQSLVLKSQLFLVDGLIYLLRLCCKVLYVDWWLCCRCLILFMSIDWFCESNMKMEEMGLTSVWLQRSWIQCEIS